MSNMPPEYERAILDGIAAFNANDVFSDAIRVAVERCYTLATKPPKEQQ